MGDTELKRIWFETDQEGFDYINEVVQGKDSTFRFGGEMITEWVDKDLSKCSDEFIGFIKLLRHHYKTMKWAIEVDDPFKKDPICTVVVLRLPLIGNMSFRSVVEIAHLMPDECTISKIDHTSKVNYWRCWWD